ncbi:terminase small subunit [Nitrospinota bacterium]
MSMENKQKRHNRSPAQKKKRATPMTKAKTLASRQKMISRGSGGLNSSTHLELPQSTREALAGWEEAAAHLHQTFNLTPQEQKFVLHYIETGKKGESAKEAGYKCADQSAQDLLNRSRVKMAIDYAQRALSTRLFAVAAQVNGALSKIATADHAPANRALLEGESFQDTLDKLAALPDEILDAIRTITINRTKEIVTLAFESRTDALYKLSQNLGLSRGAQDKDTSILIFEEIAIEEEEAPAPAGGMTQLGPGLEADFSEYEGENGPGEGG